MSLIVSSPQAVRAFHRVEAPKGGKAMNRAHILVVDDEADLLELVQYNLARAGYDVTCVGSGEEAMAAVGSARPDLVVLDVLLPGMDGLDVCKTLKGDVQTSAILIVMLTARVRRPTSWLAWKSGRTINSASPSARVNFWHASGRPCGAGGRTPFPTRK